MKRGSKILIAILFGFLIPLIATGTVQAKAMNMDELTEAIIEYNPDVTDMYIIGDYAFTSEHRLTLEDIMLAARSINVLDTEGRTDSAPVYGEMSILHYAGTYDADWNLTGFKYEKHLAGKTEAASSYDIKYIDYNKQYTVINVNTLVNKAYETIKKQAATDVFVVNKVSDTAMEIVLMNTEMTSLEALAGTGVATAAANFLAEQGIASVTLALGETKVVIDENLDQAAIENFFKALGNKSGDLVGKTLTATIAFKDGYKTANSAEFSIAFKDAAKVDVATLVDAAYTTIKNQAATDVFEVAKAGNKINVTIKNTEMTSLEALAGTGVATAAANFLNEAGVKSVTLALGEAKVVIDENLDQAAIEGFFKALGTKAGDLAGKTITATIGFEEGYKTANETKFEVSFGTQIDVNTLVDAAYATIKGQAATDLFVVNKVDTTKMEVVLMNTEMASLEALAGTGVATAAANFLAEQGIASVTLALGETKVVIDENLDQVAIENFFKALGTKAGDLVGKTLTATVAFKDAYTTANSKEFSIAFKGAEKVNVDTLVDEAYEIIKKQAATDKFVVNRTGATTMDVVLMDTEMASLEALSGTGVATAAANFLNEAGVKSVTLTLGEAKVVIDENLDQAAIESFFKALGTKAGDLVGKTITATIAFEEGYKTENSEEFEVTFKGATKVNVDTLVSKAFTTIANQAPANLFVVTRTFNQINVTIKDTEMASLEALAGTGVATAAANFLNEEGVKSVTLALGETKVVIDENLDQAAIEGFFKALGTKAGDLAGKTITATVGFEAGYETANSTSFDVVFGTLVDVNTMVDKAYETIEKQAATDKFVVNRTGAATMDVVLMDTEMASLEALAGTGVATAAANFLNEEGIAYVTLSVGQTNISINEELDQAAIEGFFKALGTKAGDLVGKTITAEIVFKAGFGTKNSEKFEVTFKESEKVDVNELAEEAFNTIKNQAPANLFTIAKQGNNIGVTIKDTEMASLEALAGTGVATAAANFLNEEGIKSVTLTLGEAKVVIDENLDQAAIEGFFKALGTKAGDLAGKTITATIAFEAGFETANSTKFEVSFGTQVDVNTMVDEAYDIIKKQAATDVFVVNRVGVTDIEVVLMDTEMTSLDALAGTGVATAAANFLNEEGIKSVTLALGNTKVTIDENLDQAAIETFFKALGNKAGDLVEKEITATITFEEGFGTKNSEEFTVVFRDSEKVDVNELADEAYETIKNQAPANLFVVSKTGNNINVTIKDTEMASLEALAGTGIATAAANFLNEAGVKSVTLTLGEAKVVIDENLDQAAIEGFFKALGTKAGDLAGKTITAEIAFEAGFETANAAKFEVSFGTQVDVNEMVEDAFETIKKQAATDVFEVNLKDATTIEVVLKDTEMESLEALAGTGVATAAANFLNENGIASVTLSLGSAKVVIDENLNQAAIETFFKELGTTAGDLVGRPMTAEIAFKDGFETKNSQEFTILFSEAVEVNF